MKARHLIVVTFALFNWNEFPDVLCMEAITAGFEHPPGHFISNKDFTAIINDKSRFGKSIQEPFVIGKSRQVVSIQKMELTGAEISTKQRRRERKEAAII
jgi:hypothetical protein